MRARRTAARKRRCGKTRSPADALHFLERRPCSDGLVEMLVVLAGAPKPILRDVVATIVREAHRLHRGDEGCCGRLGATDEARRGAAR